ncbi:6-bladed beta-propeller [Sphingobacterium sp. DN00404]|uniref:6-bladed beta-propeller n=1 Tax=Sphingobacterium micropteri TaxID=2763501 RepID=A0ABR7YNJ4_9SPHI|nr:BF3164 family lipoprotein [Sphingobacterium micropteri]MBD1432867.1 6-bladed beta-propeller [Sphingobacterium micropteri]
MMENKCIKLAMSFLRCCFFIAVLSGCHRAADQEKFVFKSEKLVSSSPIPIDDSVIMSFPFRLVKNDSLMFILGLGSDYFVHLFSTDGNFYRSLCKRGEGPNEFISVNGLQLDGDSLYIYDSRNEIYVYHVNDIYDGNEAPKRVKLPDDYGFLSRGMKSGNSFYFPVFNSLSDHRILEFNSDGTLKRSFGKIPTQEDDFVAATYQAWMPFLGVADTLLVAGTQFGEVLEIYDGQKQTTLWGKFGEPVFKIHNGFAIQEGIYGFQDIVVNNGHIYALFSGQRVNQERRKDGGNVIYVFDYRGKPIQKLVLDRYFVSIFADNNESFLALDANSDSPVYKFSIPN